MLDGPRVGPAQGGAADALVVFLHGYGSNGDDLIALAPHFARALPGAMFVSPNAPEPVPFFPGGRQWFAIPEISEKLMGVGAEQAAPTLNAFLDEELARLDLTDDRLAVVGFSQGAMMTLYAGLRRSPGPAALVGFSGIAVGADRLPLEIQSRPPTLLVHGDSDPTVPSHFLSWSAERLEAVNVPVFAHMCDGVGHGISPDGLMLAVRHVSRALAVQTADG